MCNIADGAPMVMHPVDLFLTSPLGLGLVQDKQVEPAFVDSFTAVFVTCVCVMCNICTSSNLNTFV